MKASFPVLKAGERLDDLERSGLKIIQHPDSFCFGTDAVLLSSFANVKKGEKVCDLGTGSGIIPLLLSARSKAAKFVGIEIQPNIADMARRSMELNGLADLIEIMNIDIKDASGILGHGGFDALTCNPPYVKSGSGLAQLNASQRIARSEILITLPECVQAASKLLKNGGRAYFIHQADRLFELWQLMREVKIEPKRTRLIHPDEKKPPNLVLVEGFKLGRPGIMWLAPLFIFKDGGYSSEINSIYHKF